MYDWLKYCMVGQDREGYEYGLVMFYVMRKGMVIIGES